MLEAVDRAGKSELASNASSEERVDGATDDGPTDAAAIAPPRDS